MGKRLINGELTESDLFLDLSSEEQCLYFHSCLYADDEGFIKNPKSVCRIIGVDYSVCEALIQKGFYISFTSGVLVVTHWFFHNTIRKDRMKETIFSEEKKYLIKSETGIYNVLKNNDDNQLTTNCQPSVLPIIIINSIYNIIYNTNNNIISNTNRITCSEIASDSEQQPGTSETIVYSLPLKDGSMFDITSEEYDKYMSLYPNVDVMQAFRNMQGWLESHISMKKTRRDIKAFITGWLQKDQKEATTGSQKTSVYAGKKTKMKTMIEESNIFLEDC